MTQEIDGSGERRKQEEPLVWKPWTPPITGPIQPLPFQPLTGTEDEGGVKAVGAISADRNGTGELAARALDRALALHVDLDALKVPLAPQVQATANAIGELGVASAVSQVALAITRTPIAPDHLADTLGRFADHLTKVSGKLLAVPGVGEALQVFGGVGGVVAGAQGLKRELEDIKAKGLGPQNALGAASRAAQLIGGVALALSPLCPALAPVGAAVMTAGAALALGKLGWEHRDGVKQAAKIVSNNTARLVSNNSAAVISNNGARIASPGDHGVGSPAWGWVTG